MSATRIAILRDRLSKIEDAIVALGLGQQTVSLSYEGNSVAYTPANMDALQALKRQTQADLNRLLRGSSGRMPMRKIY